MDPLQHRSIDGPEGVPILPTSQRSMDRAEIVAKLIVETILPGAKLEYCLEQSHGEYDFDLYYPNGVVAAVEVTESTDQLQKWTSAKIRSKKDGGPIIKARHCKKSWMIFPTNDAKTIPVIRRKADEYLARVEQAGLDSFRCLDAYTARQQREAGLEKVFSPPVPRCVEDICYDLKILGGSVISNGASPQIFISHPRGGGAVGPGTAVRAGEREASKEDNRKKLGAAKTDERHFVVYIDIGLPWIALTTLEPPSTLPELPEEMTHIWLIGHSGVANKDEFIVWTASTKEPWRGQRVCCPRS
jgi:hypothetical protein